MIGGSNYNYKYDFGLVILGDLLDDLLHDFDRFSLTSPKKHFLPLALQLLCVGGGASGNILIPYAMEK